MSYILDALKRADAERERGAVPGLHSQTAAPSPAQAPAQASARRPLLWALGLGALLLLVAALWWLQRPDTTPPAPVPTAAPVASAPTPELAPTVAPAPLPTAPAPAPAALPTSVTPILRPEPPTNAMVPAQTAPTRTTTTVSSPPPAPPKAEATEANDAGVRRFADLSPEQRAQLPQLSVNGASYSANPAHRMLIVNGAVVHEGQEVAPGLTLERIGLHQAVIRQGGLRFSIAY